MAEAFIIVGILIILVFLIIFLRKKIFALLIDCALGFILYILILFLISMAGIHTPILLADAGLPICIVGVIVYHLIANLAKPTAKAYGSL